MAHEKTQLGPVLTQQDGLQTRDVFLRIDPRIDLYIKEIWQPAGYAFTTEEEWPDLFIPTAPPAVTAWHQARFGTAYAYPVGPYVAVAGLPAVKEPARITADVLVVTGDRDPFAALEDTRAFLHAIGSTRARHLYQAGIGHMPYVERDAAEVRLAIEELIDASTERSARQ